MGHTGWPAYAVSAVRLRMDVHATLLGVTTTHIAATLAPGNDAFDASFTSKAAHPDGRVLSRASGMQADRAAAISERARAEAREP